MMGREECSLQMRRLLPRSRVSALHLSGGRTCARPISLRTHRSSHAAVIALSAQGHLPSVLPICSRTVGSLLAILVTY